ncbi:hypothetical protein ACLOJK_032010 [Asimina triloba]
MWHSGGGGGNPYPERRDEADCVYYMRTGFCGYGARCRFNHPRDRSGMSANLPFGYLGFGLDVNLGKDWLVAGVVRTRGGELPERPEQPICQLICMGGILVGDNRLSGGFVAQGEKECAYYVKTGQCKFGSTCKFHHPQPAGISLPASAPTFYPAVQSPSVPPPQYGMTSWPVARPPVVPNSYVQGPYGPVLISPGVVQVPGWSPYPPLVSPIASPGTQPSAGTSSLYSSMHQLSPSAPAYVGLFSSSFTAGPSSSTQKEHKFPQRPDTIIHQRGVCPKILVLSAPSASLYVQFGLTCKFDHPMGLLSYNASPSSLADMPVIPYPVESSLATLTSSSSMELRPSSESVGTILAKASGSVPQSRVQVSTQNSAALSGSRSTGRGSMSS